MNVRPIRCGINCQLVRQEILSYLSVSEVTDLYLRAKPGKEATSINRCCQH